jgi:hypothetical protein
MLVVFATGTAVASNALLIGEVSRRTAPAERGMAAGVIGAGGPAGQLLLRRSSRSRSRCRAGSRRCARSARSPCSRCRWRARSPSPAPLPKAAPTRLSGNGEALRDPRFWLIAGSFAICGFHVAFLTVHMPGVIERCGLPRRSRACGWSSPAPPTWPAASASAC